MTRFIGYYSTIFVPTLLLSGLIRVSLAMDLLYRGFIKSKFKNEVTCWGGTLNTLQIQ